MNKYLDGIALVCFNNPSCISKSCIKIKSNLKIYFQTSLWCFKRCYEGLSDLCRLQTVSGEETTRTAEMPAVWEQNDLPMIFSRYELRDIYNADDFGLWWLLSTKTFYLKGERCARGKICKVRLTSLAVTNGIGEILPKLVIVKAEKPQCFKMLQAYCVSIGPQKNPGWTLKS